jgi:hypothetical protein
MHAYGAGVVQNILCVYVGFALDEKLANIDLA